LALEPAAQQMLEPAAQHLVVRPLTSACLAAERPRPKLLRPLLQARQWHRNREALNALIRSPPTPLARRLRLRLLPQTRY